MCAVLPVIAMLPRPASQPPPLPWPSPRACSPHCASGSRVPGCRLDASRGGAMHRLATSLASNAYAKAHDAGGSIHPKGKSGGKRCGACCFLCVWVGTEPAAVPAGWPAGRAQPSNHLPSPLPPVPRTLHNHAAWPAADASLPPFAALQTTSACGAARPAAAPRAAAARAAPAGGAWAGAAAAPHPSWAAPCTGERAPMLARCSHLKA